MADLYNVKFYYGGILKGWDGIAFPYFDNYSSTSTIASAWEGNEYNYILETGFSYTENLSVDGKRAYSTLDLTLNLPQAEFQQFVNNTELIGVSIDKNWWPYFYGYIRPNASFSIYEDLRTFTVQVLDVSVMLDRALEEDIIFTDVKICDATDVNNSLIHKLAAITEYTPFSVNTTVYNDTLLEAFKIEKGQTISDVLTTLCEEYGYGFTISPDDNAINLINAYPDTITTGVVIGNANIVQPLQVEKTDNENEGVIVKWNALTTETDKLVYREIKDAESKKAVYPNLFYPANSNNKEIYQRFKVVDEDVDLLHSSNHTLVLNADEEITQVTAIFEPTQAQISLQNTSATELKYIYQFDVRADVIVRHEENETKIIPETSRYYPEEFSTEYVYDEASAERLANILYNRQIKRAYHFTFMSKYPYQVGSFATLQDTKTGLTTTVLITKVNRNQTLNELYNMECISAGDISFQTAALSLRSFRSTAMAGTLALDTKVVTIESRLDEVELITTEQESTLDGLDTRVGVVEGDVLTQGTTLGEQVSALLALDVKVGINETSIGTINTTLGSHSDSINDFTTSIGTITTTLGSHSTSISDFATRITGAETNITTIDGQVSTLITDVGTIDGIVSTQGTAITQNATDITSLAGRMDTAEGTVSTYGTSISQNATDITSVASRTTTLEGTVSTQGTAITQNADEISSLASSVTTINGTLSTHGTSISQNATDITSVASRTTTLEGTVSTQGTAITQNADEISSLATLVAAIEGVDEGWQEFATTINQNAANISSLATRTTTLEGTVSTQGTSITQNATDITSLASSVTTINGTLSTQGTAITQNATDITSLASSVTTINGTLSTHGTSITQNADSITSLATSVSTHSTSITQNATDITSLAGRMDTAEGTITTYGTSITQNADSISSIATRVTAIDGEGGILEQHTSQISQTADNIGLRVEAVDTLGNSVVGAKLEIGTIDGASYIMLDADKILIDGSIKAQKIDTESLTSDEGFIDNLGATTLTLQNNGVIKSSSYSAGGEGFAIKANGEVEFGSGTFRGNIISTDASFYSGSIKNGQLETSSSSGTAYKFNESTIMNTQFNTIMAAPVGFLESGSTVTSLQASGSRTLLNPARNFSGSWSDLRPEIHRNETTGVSVYNPCGMSPYVFYSTNGVNWYPAAEEIFVEPYTNCYISNDYHTGYTPSKNLFWFYRRTQRVWGDSYWYYHKIYRSTDGKNWSYTGIPSDWASQHNEATLFYLDTVNKWILINRANFTDKRVYLSSDISNVANWVRHNDILPKNETSSSSGYHYNEVTKELWLQCGDVNNNPTTYATQDGLNWYVLSIPSDIKYLINLRSVNFPDKGFGFIWGSFGGIYKIQNGVYTAINHPFINPFYIKDIIWDSQFNKFVLIGYDYNSTDGHRSAIAFTTDFTNYEYRRYTFTNGLGQTVYNPTTHLYSSLGSQWLSGDDMGQYMATFTLSKQTTTATKISKTNVMTNYLDLSFNDNGNLTFPVSNENKVFSFSANAEIPERLLIKKDMNFETGLNVNLDKKALIWGAVAN